MTSISKFDDSTYETLLPGEARAEEVDDEMQKTLQRMRGRNWELLVENRKTKRRDLAQKIRDGVKRIQTVTPEAFTPPKKKATPVVKPYASLLSPKKEVALPSAAAAAAKASGAQNKKEPEADLVKKNIEKVRPQAAPVASATAAAASSFEERRAKLRQEIAAHVGLTPKLAPVGTDAFPVELKQLAALVEAADTEHAIAGIELQVTEWIKNDTLALLHADPEFDAVLKAGYKSARAAVRLFAKGAAQEIQAHFAQDEGLPPDYYNY